MSTKRLDTDEDVALVDVNNAAAESLFSPNMWIRRPSRDPRLSAAPIDYQEPSSLVKDVRPRASAGFYSPPRPTNAASPARRGTKRPADTGFDIVEAMEKEGSQKEQAEQDLAHIAALETEIERARGICLLLEARLQESSADVTTTVTENNSIKRLFEAVGVMRDDFNMESCADEPARKRRMTETGRRLIKNLGGEPPAAVAEPDAGRWVPTNQGQTPAPPAPMSARPVVTPPAAFPVESQVAAAALTLAKGNPAGALLSLLQKALSARVPMQSSQPADGQGQMHQAAVVQAAPVTAVL